MSLKLGLPKIFYGWWIVTACFIIVIAAGGVSVYGFTAFFDPIIKEFGWSYAAVSLAASLRGAETGIMAPVLGFFVDRWGTKWILLTGSILTGVGMILLSRVSTLAQFYGAFIIVAISISCCGAGVVNPAITHWFRRNLGKATGILAAAFALGGLMVPLIYKLIELYGWRQALVILGISCIVICTPLSLVVRHKPEQYGLVPDGISESLNSKSLDAHTPGNISASADVNIGVSQALKTRTFWQLTLAFTFQYMVVAAVIAHIMPFLSSVHVDRSTASFFAAAIPVLSIFGRVGSGWLSDKFSTRQVAIGSFIIVCIGTLLFDYVSNLAIWVLVLATITFSVSYGSANTLRVLLVREYFGRNRFGTIFGFMIGLLSFGAMLGPFLAGWTFDVWKSYHYAWLVFTAINLVALILLLTTPRVKIAGLAEQKSSSI